MERKLKQELDRELEQELQFNLYIIFRTVTYQAFKIKIAEKRLYVNSLLYNFFSLLKYRYFFHKRL